MQIDVLPAPGRANGDGVGHVRGPRVERGNRQYSANSTQSQEAEQMVCSSLLSGYCLRNAFLNRLTSFSTTKPIISPPTAQADALASQATTGIRAKDCARASSR